MRGTVGGVASGAGLVIALTVGCGQQASFTDDASTRSRNGSQDATAAGVGVEPMPGSVDSGDPHSIDDEGPGGKGPTGVGAKGQDGTTTDADGGHADGPAADGNAADGNGTDGKATDGGTADGTSVNDGGGGDAVADGVTDGAGTDAPGVDATPPGDGGGGAGGGGDGGAGDGTMPGGDSGEEPELGAKRTVTATQPGAGKVDILWVVDTSVSMKEEQAYLGQNFDMMIRELQRGGHDFQTAVTTTDVCQNTLPADLSQRVCPVDYGGTPATHLRGSFTGEEGHRVLKSTDADLVTRFNDYVHLGIDGSNFEHGLTAAQLAIAKSIGGQNEALVRDDAFLAVIVVSDEEDDGIGLSQEDGFNHYNFWEEGLTTYKYTEDNMISYLRTVKGEGKFSVSAITGTRNPDGTLCSSPHSTPYEEGLQYIKAAKKTGGIIQSICETNWSTSLAQIGLDLNAQLTQVKLPSVPVVSTIQVKVNGTATTHWTYNAGNNAVKFDAGFVPATGAAIVVTYFEPK